MTQPIKITVTGAAGQLAYALLFRIASGQMLGENVPVDLRLLEVESALSRAKGVQMELEDCAFPLLHKITCTADANVAMQDANWAVLIGACPRKAGMERADLLGINANIFQVQGKALNNYAARDVRVLVVGNPCNTNCLVAIHHAPSLPSQHFYAMTTLDELRARFRLAEKAGILVDKVTDLIVWGNHSTTQYPDFYYAKIDGKPCTKMLDEKWLQTEFLARIKNRGGEILIARGISSGASAANAIIECVKNIAHDTQHIYSLGCYSAGEYGIDQDLVFSFPCGTKNGEVKIVAGIEHNDFGKQQLAATLEELKKEREMVKKLGFLS